MRICFISHLSHMTGAELAMVEVIEGLMAYGVNCLVVLPEPGPLMAELELRGVECEICHFNWWVGTQPRRGLRGLRDRARVFWQQHTRGRVIARLLSPWRPDVVVTNTLCMAVGAFAARRLRVAHVWYIHEFGLLDWGLRFMLGRWLSLWLMNRYSGAVICNSRAVADHFSDRITAAKLHMIYYPMNPRPEAGAVLPAAPRQKGFLHCMIVGVVTPSKRQEDAVIAVAQLVRAGLDVRLSIVGTEIPEYRKLLDQLIADYDINERIEFVPWVPDPSAYMRAADVLLMCSRMEAFGRVTVEAMQLGRPVIGARGGATPELIRDGKTGLLFEVANPTDLADKIRKLYENRELLMKLGTSARGWTEETFREERTTTRVYDLLRGCSKGNSSSKVVR